MNNKILEQCLENSYSRRDFIALAREIIPFEVVEPIPIETNSAEKEKVEAFNYLGAMQIEDKNIHLLEVELKNTALERSPTFQRNLVAKYLSKSNLVDAAIVSFYSKNGSSWKLSLVTVRYKLKDGKPTEELSEAKRFSFIVGVGQPIHTATVQLGKLAGKQNSYQEILDAFSVERVTKDFFIKISDWYAWALDNVQFPEDAEKDENGRKIALIRFLTRIMFIWFMKQKGLIPDYLFDKDKIKGILNDLSDGESTYYKAILQNLFFATLSTPPKKRTFRRSETYKGYLNKDYMIHNRYRYQSLFKNPDKMISIFGKIPFLNGGLFECLDKSSKENNNQGEIRIDGFSDKPGNSPKFPNKLFFSHKKDAELNSYYGTKNKKYWVEGLINIFKRYNFTVIESTPVDINIALDPELLGKVFENLLASYNPETATTARKATGSYYTPREIVHYMVDESVKAYLKTKLDGVENIDKKLGELFSNNTDKHSFNKTETEKLVKAIDKIRIIDLAVGSGAFPMGILQRLVDFLSKLDPDNKIWKKIQKEKILKKIDKVLEKIVSKDERGKELKKLNNVFERNTSNYGRKLYLTKNCIYGVDIQPIAIQIAKLRFFISLLVDMKIDENKENLGIEPLPNLETRFIAANSLLGLDNEEQLSFKSSEIEKLENELKEVRNSYFDMSDIKLKNKLHDRDKQIREKIGVLLKNKFSPESTQKIIDWDPYDSNTATSWFDPEWMFGIKDGFDIVIANPPYIQLQKPFNNNKKYADLYKNQSYETFDRTGDIYCLFYEKGLNLLKEKGVLTYISSNKWMRAKYGRKLRKYFSKFDPKIIIDLGPNVFKEATVDTSILLIQNAKNQNSLQGVSVSGKRVDNLSVYFNENAIALPDFDGESWVIGSSSEQKLKEKIEKAGVPLKEWDVNIYYGIKTGFNEAFIISTKKRNEILANCRTVEERQRTEEIIKPILRGRDIGRYYYKWKDLWVIGTFPALHIDIENYPAIKKYFLDNFKKERLEQSGKVLSDGSKSRKKTANKWFETQDTIAYYPEFEKEKIVWTAVNSEYKFTVVKPGIYFNNSIFMITNFKPKFLCGLFNSKLIRKYLVFLFSSEDNYTYGSKAVMNKVPLPRISEDRIQAVNKIITLVNQILSITSKETYDPEAGTADSKKVKALEHQIDQLVYKLYNLTPEEMKIIENSINNGGKNG